MDTKERANRFLIARTGLNKHGEETKAKVYEETGVPASALVDYENPDSSRALNLDYVQKLADHYGLNAAWLLGQSDSWSTEGDIRQICDATGLSPESVWILKDLMKDEQRKKLINAFIESEEFSRLILILEKIRLSPACDGNEGTVDYSRAFSLLSEDQDTVFNEGDYREMRFWQASREMENLIRRIVEK